MECLRVPEKRCHSSLTVRICAGSGHAFMNASNRSLSRVFTGVSQSKAAFNSVIVWLVSCPLRKRQKSRLFTTKARDRHEYWLTCRQWLGFTFHLWCILWCSAGTNHRLTWERQMPSSLRTISCEYTKNESKEVKSRVWKHLKQTLKNIEHYN